MVWFANLQSLYIKLTMQTVTRLFDFPYYQLEKYPLEKSLVTKSDGTWIATSTQEYIDKANAVSRALLKMGVKPNDKIAVISMTNRSEWNIVDIGILQIGAQNVPIYPTISEEITNIFWTTPRQNFVLFPAMKFWRKCRRFNQK